MGKKICFLGRGLKVGGQERALTSMANYFAGCGHQVSIINLFTTEQFYELKSSIEVFWPDISRNNHKSRYVYALLILTYIRNTIRGIKPDVLLSYGEWFNPYVIIATRYLDIPLYVLDRMGPKMKLDPMIEIARKMLYKYCEGVIVQTETAAKIIAEKTCTRNISVIPNPVNIINADTSSKKSMIVSVGRLSREKGHIYLIRAFSKVKHIEWTLHIVGDGPEMQSLKQEAMSLGIYDRVEFHGYMKDFSEIMGESEIFVLPSLYEGYPNALLEAMSVPLPCISSDCIAGPSDIINHGLNGILVEPGSVDALVIALNRLIENPDQRKSMATEGFKIRETLAFDKIAQRYLDCIFETHEYVTKKPK